MIIKPETPKEEGTLSWLGKFNDPAPNWKEVDEAEVVRKTPFGSFYPVHIDYKQILSKDRKQLLAVMLYVYSDGRGVGISTIQNPQKGEKHIRWFTFCKCEHDYDVVNIGNCLNRYACKKCGYTHEVDSSD